MPVVMEPRNAGLPGSNRNRNTYNKTNPGVRLVLRPVARTYQYPVYLGRHCTPITGLLAWHVCVHVPVGPAHHHRRYLLWNAISSKSGSLMCLCLVSWLPVPRTDACDGSGLRVLVLIFVGFLSLQLGLDYQPRSHFAKKRGYR